MVIPRRFNSTPRLSILSLMANPSFGYLFLKCVIASRVRRWSGNVDDAIVVKFVDVCAGFVLLCERSENGRVLWFVG